MMLLLELCPVGFEHWTSSSADAESSRLCLGSIESGLLKSKAKAKPAYAIVRCAQPEKILVESEKIRRIPQALK